MNAERLLAYYDQVADAPDAVARVRRFILDLAVRGKLVPQSRRDVPASELLQQIAADKARLVKLREIARDKPLPQLAISDTVFDLPHGWEWARLGHLTQIVTSGSRDWAKHYSNEGAIFIRMGNLSKDHYRLRLDRIQHVKPPSNGEGTRTRLEGGDILISITGDVGLLGLVPEEFGEAYINQHTAMVRPIAQMKGRYLAELFRSPFAQAQFNEPQRGIKNSFRLTDITQLVVPLPPLAEQHRIVAKIDELMELCDRLEAARVDREAARDRLAAASLARLNAPEACEPRPSALALSPLPPVPGRTAMSATAISSTQDTGNAFVGHAGFILDALPAITARPDQVKALRRAILGLAVRGQLVPQDENDQPEAVPGALASAALDGRLNIDIPQNWQWVRVEDVAEARLGKMLDKDKNKGKLYPYLRNSNVHWFEIRTGDLSSIRLNDAELEEYRLKDGDVLICEGGHGIGRTAVWRGDSRNIVFQKALHRVRVGAHLDPDFFAQCCFVYYDIGIMQAYFTGVGIQHFTGRALSKLVFPLPPLAEQHRIVAKVDELMVLCDKLEASLTTAADTRRRLLDALLAEAIAPDENRLLDAAE